MISSRVPAALEPRPGERWYIVGVSVLVDARRSQIHDGRLVVVVAVVVTVVDIAVELLVVLDIHPFFLACHSYSREGI